MDNGATTGQVREAQAQSEGSPQPEQSYTASIFPGENATISADLAQAVRRLEEVLSEEAEMTTQIWLLIQPGKNENEVRKGAYADLNRNVRRAFFSQREKLSQNDQVVLLIDSSGGSAKAGYQLAMFFRHFCGRFVALVPRAAKSAATLLAIGADEIILGNSGELGPVDAQVLEGNDYVPVLDRVKALERLHASALEAFDRTMALLTLRTEQDVDELVPIAADFAARLSQPYIQKQDMLEYTRMSRVLKIGEDYASRLLYRQGEHRLKSSEGNGSARSDDQPNLQRAKRDAEDALLEDELFSDYSDPSKRRARLLAQHLVGAYPDHDFAIDADEAKRIKLQVRDPSDDLAHTIDELYLVLGERAHTGVTAIGRFEETMNG
jgi:hypothetical protein